MHYYKRHIGDYAKKAGHLTPLEHGVYNLIIDSYYDREQAPTLLEAMRWARARTEEEKSAVLAVLDEFFVMEGERYQQNRIEEELAIYHGKAEVNRQIAIAREQAKKDRREHDRGTPERRTVARSEHESCTVGAPETHDMSTPGQPNHKPLTTNQKKSVEARGSRLPADWHPSPEDTEFCKRTRPDLRPSEVAQRFYDYWTGVPGAKGRKVSWDGTWRNWVRDEKPGKAGDAPAKKDWE
jgi:uncharacterized protein YdaU (DUF1376 family)